MRDETQIIISSSLRAKEIFSLGIIILFLFFLNGCEDYSSSADDKEPESLHGHYKGYVKYTSFSDWESDVVYEDNNSSIIVIDFNDEIILSISMPQGVSGSIRFYKTKFNYETHWAEFDRGKSSYSIWIDGATTRGTVIIYPEDESYGYRRDWNCTIDK